MAPKGESKKGRKTMSIRGDDGQASCSTESGLGPSEFSIASVFPGRALFLSRSLSVLNGEPRASRLLGSQAQRGRRRSLSRKRASGGRGWRRRRWNRRTAISVVGPPTSSVGVGDGGGKTTRTATEEPRLLWLRITAQDVQVPERLHRLRRPADHPALLPESTFRRCLVATHYLPSLRRILTPLSTLITPCLPTT